MQRNSFRTLLRIVLLLLLPVRVFPQDAGTSAELYSLFIGRGFQTDYQGLCPSQSEIYPRNIIVNIPSEKARPTEETGKTGLETVCLIFPQEDAAANKDAFLDFAGQISGEGLPFSVRLVLAANEGSLILPASEGYEHPTGIPVFAESLDSGRNSCVIVARSGIRNRLSSGGGGVVSPIWLIKPLKEACEENGISAWLPNSASFLYRLGLMSEDERLSPFLEESIPAAGLYLNGAEDYLEILRLLLGKLAGANTSGWDIHYAYISVLSLEFWLDETFFLLCYIATALIVLLITCFSTAWQSDRNRAVVQDISKAWYIILIMLAYTAAVLQLSQKIPGIRSPFAAATMGKRLAIAMAASLVLFVLFSRFKAFISFESVSRIMLFIAACNIFIFSAIDISFLFLFLSEYLTCFLAKRAKSKTTIVAGLILMALPFLPHIVNILLSSNPRSLARLASPGPIGNLLTALILIPFQLQFLRLLMQMEFFSRRRKKFFLLRILSAVLFIAVSVCLFALFYFLVIRTLAWTSFASLRASMENREERDAVRWEPPPKFTEDTEADHVRASYSADGFMEYNFVTMTIRGDGLGQVLRYDITLETESGIPLNDCNYGYSLSGRHKAYIAIPDKPSSDLSIVFTSEKGVSPIAFITSYLKTADGRYIVEKDALNMPFSEGGN